MKKTYKRKFLNKKLTKKRRPKIGGMKEKNVYNSKLEICSKSPMTGYYRDGYCKTDRNDFGKHTVCGKITPEFLEFSKKRGNDLTSVVNSNDRWCLCENRWLEAHKNNVKVEVIKESSNFAMNPEIKNIILD